MGVTGLWRLIESSGRPVAFETLEDKVIVIDISLWLHQVVKGYTDGRGGHIHNSHLLGLFNRICKLLYFRIKPIFVFDGKVCSLKWQTIAKRAQQKSKLKTESEKIEELLLQSLAKEKIIKEALGLDTKSLTLSPVKKKTPAKEEKDDMFKLPNIESQEKFTVKAEEDDLGSPKKSYNLNINKIDVQSSYFKSLAPDIRHDILIDIKETRKQNTWAKLRDLPVESQDFSSYQMAGLLKRRQVQVSLEEAEKEMGGKVFSMSELESLLAEDGVLEVGSKHAQKIAGDENTRFLLVRDISKLMKEAKEKESIKEEPQPSTSKDFPIKSENLENEDDYDFELQKAIQMSLGNEECEEILDIKEVNNDPIKLNAQQRRKFVSSIQSHGLVKGFMKEYGEMNDDDIKDLIDATQIQQEPDTQNDSLTQKFPHTDRYVLYGTPEKTQPDSKQSPENSQIKLPKQLELSPKNDEPTIILEKPKTQEIEKSQKKEIVITIDSTNFSQEEDIFADVFKSKPEIEKLEPDVEVASISSDDNTIEYDVAEHDYLEVDKELKESESGFVSEIDKILEVENVENERSKNESPKVTPEIEIIEDSNDAVPCSENEKFWNLLSDEEESIKTQKTKVQSIKEKTPELSENEKFWSLDEPAVESVKNIEEKNLTQEKAVKQQVISLEMSPQNQEKPSESTSLEKVVEIESDDEKLKVNGEIVMRPQEKTPEKGTKYLEEEDIAEAAEILRKELTNDELLQMGDDIKKQQKDYEFERNKLDRQGTSITESMSSECKELLRIFGIPYIDAPTEAEAQCAFLNSVQLADGIITDDSDVWLFGAKTVYKNFFLQKKVVKRFDMDDIEDKFRLNRNKLIQLGMLVGSDYTVGLNGVGAVTALEILAAFPPTEEENGTDIYQSLLSSLRKFRDWFENGKVETGNNKGLKSKLKNVEIIPGFPSVSVMKAYLEPTIDDSLENFSWGTPDEESIYEFAKFKLGWTRTKTKEILDPVMKRFKERKQKKMEDYFGVQLKKKALDNQKLSKRVQSAIVKMGGSEAVTESSNQKTPEKKKTRKRKAKVSAKEKKEIKAIQNDAALLLSEDDDDSYEPPLKKASPEKLKSPEKISSPIKETVSTPEKLKNGLVNAFNLLKSPPKQTKTPSSKLALKRKMKDTEPKPSTSKDAILDEILQSKRPPRIPETKQVIPQREKDKMEQELIKQKAIEIFKKRIPQRKKK